MNDGQRTPGGIKAMKEAMAELARARGFLEDALRETNAPEIRAHFEALLELSGMVVAQGKKGNTRFLADDLSTLTSQVKRLKLEDIDSDLDAVSRSMVNLRGAQGNMLIALNTCSESAAAIGMFPSSNEGAPIVIAGAQVNELIIRLDERLNRVESDVTDLAREVREADGVSSNNQRHQSLLGVHIETIKTEVSAARFETKIASDNALSAGVDLSALARSVEAMLAVGKDLKAAATVFSARTVETVARASAVLVKSTERAFKGMQTIVRAIRKRSTKPAANKRGEPESAPSPPSDFDLDEARAMILRGEAPPVQWRPFIKALSFNLEDLSDVNPLSGLTALQRLDLDHTQVSDVTALSGLTALQGLYLDGTQVSDLTGVSGLTALQGLYLDGTQVSDVTALSGLTALQTLDLTGTQVSDVTALSGLTALQTLILAGTQVSDVTALSGLTALQELYLRVTQVRDVAALSDLTALQTLGLNGTPVSDVTALSGLTALQKLDLDGTQVSDVTALSGLMALQTLFLSGTQVRDVAALSGLTALEALTLGGTPVSDVTALSGLTALQTLFLSGTQVRDVAALSGLTALEALTLGGTQVNDVTALSGLTALQMLVLAGTQVSDVTALSDLTALQTLDLGGTPVSDVTALSGLTALETLTLTGTWVSGEDITALKQALPDCNIVSGPAED